MTPTYDETIESVAAGFTARLTAEFMAEQTAAQTETLILNLDRIQAEIFRLQAEMDGAAPAGWEDLANVR